MTVDSLSLEGQASLAGAEPTPQAAAPNHPHLFALADLAADVFEGGTLRGATEAKWRILEGQRGSVYLARLQPGGVREPNWHPSAWEFNYVISGMAKWTLVGPRAAHDEFEAKAGDLVFAPPGHFHYFENAGSSEDLVVLIIFNASMEEPDDDIGVVASLSAIPADVLAAVFKAPISVFENLPRRIERVTIANKAATGGKTLGDACSS